MKTIFLDLSSCCRLSDPKENQWCCLFVFSNPCGYKSCSDKSMHVRGECTEVRALFTSALRSTPANVIVSRTTLKQNRRLLMNSSSATNRWRQNKWILMLLFALFLPFSSALAQTSNTGTLTGVVKDEKGAVVPGATVKLTDLGTNSARTTTTSGEGVY